MWITFALLSALFLAVRRLFEKSLTAQLSFFSLGWIVQIFSLPLTAGLLFWTAVPNPLALSGNFWYPLLIIWLILYPIQTYCYYRSIREGQLSEVLPLLSLTAVFNIFVSWWMIGERPTLFGALGIASIVLAIYILRLQEHEDLLYPFRHFFTHKASVLMMVNSVSIALGSTLDKVAIQASNPLYYNFMNTLGAGIVLFVIARMQRVADLPVIKKVFPLLLVVGLFQSLSYTSYILALSSNYVAYAVAIKGSNVIIGALLGIWFLREEFTRKKVMSLGFIGLGFLFFGLR